MSIIFIIVVIGVFCFIYELMTSKDFRTKIRSLLGWIALIAWGILVAGVTTKQYVGVQVFYIGLPIALFSSATWLYLWKHRNTDVDLSV